MTTMIAPRMDPGPSPMTDRPDQKLARLKPRSKASNIPAFTVVGSPTSTSPSSSSNPAAGNHLSHATAPVLPASSTSNSSHASFLLSQPVCSISNRSSSGAMSVGANVKPNIQPAPAPNQLRTQRNPTHQSPDSHTAHTPSTLQLQQSNHPGVVNTENNSAQTASVAQFIGSPENSVGTVGIQSPHFVQENPGSNNPHRSQSIQYLQNAYPDQTGHFQVSDEGRVLMAATMRPYQEPYHPSQPQSPASVQSPHSSSMSGRHFLSQAQSQMSPTLYNNYQHYQPLSHVQQPYPHTTQSAAPPGIPTHPLLMSQQHSSPQLSQQHNRAASGVSQSPRPKLEPSAMPMQNRALDTSAGIQRPSQPTISSSQVPSMSAGNVQQSPRSAGDGANTPAAPGPIPASTPRVVRQDPDGTLWIEFEYSKDRVRMDYSIKCNVDSVNTDELSEEFRVANCVYPRAMKSKEEYLGNRYAYETDCNRIGWSLAHMNETLRGKRGLIQRAVDSWRNSNSDSKIRSRRVRRQQKLAKRDKPGMSGPGSVVPESPVTDQRPGSMHGSVDLSGNAAYQHAGIGGPTGVTGGADDVVTGAGRFIRPTPDAAYAPSMSLSMSMSNAPAPSYHHHQPLASSSGAMPPPYTSHHHHHHPHAHGMPVPYSSMPGSVQYFHGGTA